MAQAFRDAVAQTAPPPAQTIAADVQRALAEDIGTGDVTAALLPADASAYATLVCQQFATIAGTAWFEACHHQVDGETRVDWHLADGDHAEPGDLLCTLTGNARSLVTAERSAINFLQTLSGTATEVARHVAMLAGTGTHILDTRKTIPGLRAAQKYAVSCGGGCNHRFGLHDAFLVKENHIAAAGGIANAAARARELDPNLLLEIEVETLDELDLALAADVDRIMLDDFDDAALRTAVQRTNARVPLEVSGNVTASRLPELGAIGVDYVSLGSLTKNVQAIDVSMRLAMN